MEIFDGHRSLLRPLVTPAIALGNFDGVHRGHQQLLEATLAASRRLGGDAVVLTFEPHPAQVLAPAFAPPLITTLERKLELLAAAGMSACIVEPFTRELAALSPEAFARSILSDVLGARHVVVGYDFTYGHKRAGTTRTLTDFGAAHGFAVEVVDPVTVEGIVASSTKVREFVSAGKLDGARLLLGRGFDVDGTVVPGAGRGRTIGIPTANLRTAGTLLPREGVYAVTATVLDGAGAGAGDRSPLPGAANLGTNPTFTADGPDSGVPEMSLEVHLLDFSGDLYGARLRVEFVHRLRGERRFSGPEALVAQIHEDIARAREVLAARPGSAGSPSSDP